MGVTEFVAYGLQEMGHVHQGTVVHHHCIAALDDAGVAGADVHAGVEVIEVCLVLAHTDANAAGHEVKKFGAWAQRHILVALGNYLLIIHVVDWI